MMPRIPRHGRFAILRLAVDGRRDVTFVHEHACPMVSVQELEEAIDTAREAPSNKQAAHVLSALLDLEAARYAEELERLAEAEETGGQ